MFAGLAAAGLALAGCGSDGGPSQADLDAANKRAEDQAQMVTTLQNEINALRTQLGLPADGNLSTSITDLQNELNRLKNEQTTADNKAMVATAAKLYAGIGAQTAGVTATVAAGTALAADQRGAAYNDAGVPSTITPATLADTRIMVGIGTADVVTLSEDKKTMVADNHGWAGKRYADAPGGDMVEAMVYSNIEAPMMGAKFSTEYTANLTGKVLAATIVEAPANSGRVASSSFDQASGIKRFPLPDPNPSGVTKITRSGSFHGVSGTYSCTPGAAVCAARVAAKGFELGTVPSATDATWTAGSGQWTFIADNVDAKVMGAPDAAYASYGWWIHKNATGSKFTASAFVDFKGTATTVNMANLQGTATYVGGAAGKYALSSSTGGTNDAGHFTAKATLEADFGDDTISGTIDNFMGADGMARDWSVDLKEAAIADAGPITRAADDDTVWTIGGTAAAASGEWSGRPPRGGH